MDSWNRLTTATKCKFQSSMTLDLFYREMFIRVKAKAVTDELGNRTRHPYYDWPSARSLTMGTVPIPCRDNRIGCNCTMFAMPQGLRTTRHHIGRPPAFSKSDRSYLLYKSHIITHKSLDQKKRQEVLVRYRRLGFIRVA